MAKTETETPAPVPTKPTPKPATGPKLDEQTGSFLPSTYEIGKGLVRQDN